METIEKEKKDNPEQNRVVILRYQGLDEADVGNALFKRRGVTILDLHGNVLKSIHEILPVLDYSRIRRLDLSNNQIDEVPDSKALKGLVSLEIFYFHMNQLVDWSNLERFKYLNKVVHITLFGNPIVNRSGYRHFVVNSVPSLIALDLHIITDEERCEDVAQRPRFRALSSCMSFQLPSDVPTLTNSILQLQELNNQVARLRRFFEKNSPSILIQRNFRGYSVRCKYRAVLSLRHCASTLISSWFKGWKARKNLCTTLPSSYLKYYLKGIPTKLKTIALIQSYAKKYLRDQEHDRHCNQAARVITGLFRAAAVRSWTHVFDLKKFPYLYFLKDQRKKIQKILSENGFTEDEYKLLSFEDTQSTYETIRIKDPSDIKWSAYPLILFLRLSHGMKLKRRLREPIFGSSVCKESIFSHLKSNKKSEYQEILRVKRIKYNNHKQLQKYQELSLLKAKNKIYDKYSDLGIVRGPEHLLQKIVATILNHNRHFREEEPIALYFEEIMKRAAAATEIQSWYRAQRVRQSRQNFCITLRQSRALNYIQNWWRWNKLRYRIRVLEELKKYIDKIDNPVLLLEESLYLKLEEGKISPSRDFLEQKIRFGCHNLITTVWSTVNASVCPRWLHLSFPQKPDLASHLDELIGLVHNTFYPAEVLNYSKLVDPKYKGLEVQLNFVRFSCESVEEAKRRAYLLASQTYNRKHRQCMRLYTQEMLKNPIHCAQHFAMWRTFGITQHPQIPVQGHPGGVAPAIISHEQFLLNPLDCIKLKNTEVFSNVFGNVGTGADEIIDIEDIFDQPMNQETKVQHKKLAGEITKKELYKELLRYRAKYVKQEREQIAEYKKQQDISFREEAQVVANNQRTMERLIRAQHKEIYERQLDAFHKILKEEKATIKSIIDRNREESKRSNEELRMFARRMKERSAEKKMDRQFCTSFIQMQNLINKQLKITDIQKKTHYSQLEQKSLVQGRKHAEKSVRQDATIKIRNMDSLGDCASKRNSNAMQKFEVYLKRRQQANAKSVGASRRNMKETGGLQRIPNKQKGKQRPAIFREELYPIIKKEPETQRTEENEELF